MVSLGMQLIMWTSLGFGALAERVVTGRPGYRIRHGAQTVWCSGEQIRSDSVAATAFCGMS